MSNAFYKQRLLSAPPLKMLLRM